MNKLNEVLVIIDTTEEKPQVDVEFWRRDENNELDYHTYDEISSKNFKRLCKALEDYKITEVDTHAGAMIVSYYVE